MPLLEEGRWRHSLRKNPRPKLRFDVEGWCEEEKPVIASAFPKLAFHVKGCDSFKNPSVRLEEGPLFVKTEPIDPNRCQDSDYGDVQIYERKPGETRYALRTVACRRIHFDIEGWTSYANNKSSSSAAVNHRNAVKTSQLKSPNGGKSGAMTSSSGGLEANEIVLCINCREQIQDRLHVKCCECPAIICVECFSYGCEAGRHLRGHNYEVRDPLGGRTFDSKGSWGATEECKLLAAAYRFKLGNWGEVTRLMETDRPIGQVQEYYDRFFIRGPLGQFALRLLNWEETKKAMIADGSLRYHCETDRISYMMMAVDAVMASRERFDPADSDLTTKVDGLVQNYMFQISHGDERPQCSEPSEQSELIDLAMSDDSCDPSEFEMDKKVIDDAYSTGIEPENESEDEDTATQSPASAKLAKNTKKLLRKSIRPGAVFTRPSKKRIRCGLRKSTLEKNSRVSGYRRVRAVSSSSGEDSGSEDDVETMEIDHASVDDTQDSLHGLEKEDSTDDYTVSDSEELKPEPAKQSNTPSNLVRKKRRAKFVSKKARRLKEFQKRMARMTKAAERRLNELSELCPAETIRQLRDLKPDLSLYTNDYVGRPRVRQSDMDMLAYNAARSDFEWEWYNDAEQLISRLMIQESSDKTEDIENDIKFARIEKYYRILKTRKTYRRAIVEHDKINEFFRFMMNMTMEKRKASQILAERSPLEKLFTRAQQCLTKKETEDLRSHVERADELMERIAKLQELQRAGICTLKEAVLLVVVQCWTLFLMDSLPSLLILTTVVELYYLFVLSSSCLLRKTSRCSGRQGEPLRNHLLPCSIEALYEEPIYVEEVTVGNVGHLRSSMVSLSLHSPHRNVAKSFRRFRHYRRVVSCHNGGSLGEAQQGSSSNTASSSRSSANYPVNVDAVLGANTVEDIADTHPDFAGLLLDCYSVGCDLEEYKREFQRLKNLRIKRQGGVNQTLSFSLFPSVPSDLPGHLFVRLLKFHSLYEGACRNYLTDVVNKRVEASSGFPYDLSSVGIQNLVQGNRSMEYCNTSNQSATGGYSEAHFSEPSSMGPDASAGPSYSAAVNIAHSHHVPQSVAGLREDQMGESQGMLMTSPMDSTCMQRGTVNPMQQGNVHQQTGNLAFVDRRVGATPMPTWSQQTNTGSEMRSRMATPLPPLEIRQCPVVRAGLATPVPVVEGRQLQTPVPHSQGKPFTSVARMEGGQTYSGVSGPQVQQYQQMPNTSGMQSNLCTDRQLVTTTPMMGGASGQKQDSTFATPTKKPRARRKPVQPALQSQHQGQPSVTALGRHTTATPVPGWQQNQAAKSNIGLQGQPLHVMNRSMMSASVTPLQRQLSTPVSDLREMMSATPLPGWAPHQVGGGNNQIERSPLVSSLPPLSQFTPIQEPHARQLKTPYPPMQNRQLITPIPHSHTREVMSVRPYEQPSHVYPQSREMMTTTPFAQTESISILYPQGQNLTNQMSTNSTDMYSSQDIPYQWPEDNSMNVYNQQGQFVQQSSYAQQSQFGQQMNSGSQQRTSFASSEPVLYSPVVHAQQNQYPQTVENQKSSAFSQPYNYVQQGYPVAPGFQPQTTYSQDSGFSRTPYPQRSPYAHQGPQQAEQPQLAQQQHLPQQQQQQNQPLNRPLQQHPSQPMQQHRQQQQQQQHQRQHLQQQPQPIQRQLYENSAQFPSQFSQLIPTYTTQPACGIPSAQYVPGGVQVHQLSSSCEVTGAAIPQHQSSILHDDQQTASSFATGVLDMSGPSSSGAIVDLLQSRDPLTSADALGIVQGDYPGMVPSSIQGDPMLDRMMSGEIRTFDIIHCPPPPRNDSEATVPARTSPNSCSPGLIAGDDEAASLIPSIFYSKDYVQNDISDLRIEDSPLEKGLNCQHFRFDIILAMKHHRIAKEDYERTLCELDQMEKEKCVGPLGDMLMKRLGLSRQQQYSHDGKFSVDELVAAFAAKSNIQEPSVGFAGRRVSSELFSEFLDDITPVPSNSGLNQFHSGSHPDSQPLSTKDHSLNKASILQPNDAMNDLGYLLSDDVIAEFDSMSASTPAALEPSLVGTSAPFAHAESLSIDNSGNHKEMSYIVRGDSADLGSLFTSGLGDGKACIETPPLADDSNMMFTPSSSVQTPLSFGAPAELARAMIPSPNLFDQKSVVDSQPCFETEAVGLSQSLGKEIPSSFKPLSPVFTGQIAPRKPSPRNDAVTKKTVDIKVAAQPARRRDAVSNAIYESMSPFVISPEPLSDEGEWWRRDEKTPPMLEEKPALYSDATDLSTALQKSLDETESLNIPNSKSSTALDTNVSTKSSVVSWKGIAPVEQQEEVKTSKELEKSVSPQPSRSVRQKSSEREECSGKAKLTELVKKSRKTNKSLFGSDSSSEDSAKETGLLAASSSRTHHSLPSLPSASGKKSRSPHDQYSSRSLKKKGRKSSLPSRPTRDLAPKSAALSKVELSREVLAKQIAEIIEDERSKLPPEESKFPKRPLSPATLDVVIQDLMQHHISEDTSPNRELFASKLLGTDIFSKLFFRAGKCVFRHYEELDDFRSKEKGRGRRKGTASRKRDTELLRGIRKSREIQRYRDAVRAAKEPSEEEKAAAAERAKLEAMPWLSRSTFKPDVQQGSSSRFVIPKKSSTSTSGHRSSSESARGACDSKHRDMVRHTDSDNKSTRHKAVEGIAEHLKANSSADRVGHAKRSRSPLNQLGSRSSARSHQEGRPVRVLAEPVVREIEEVSASFSFVWVPKSSAYKAKVRHTWPLKRWRSASAVVEDSIELCKDIGSDVGADNDSVFDSIMEVGIDVDGFAEVPLERLSKSVEISDAFETTSFVSARESELAALALQEEMSRSEEGSPDTHYDALRYLAAMPESEFSNDAVASEPSLILTQENSFIRSGGCSVVEIPSKVITQERICVEDIPFEQVDWMRNNPPSQPFYGNEFDGDPWQLPLLASDSSVAEGTTESSGMLGVTHGSTSLYSSLQEELDTIVRDTLGDTFSPVITEAPPAATSIAEKYDWPKADIPIRSYAPDVILPPLPCDKSKIPIIDMCRCKCCTTRCEYFCDHDEWKYLFDCAVSRRRDREQTLLFSVPLPDEVCSESVELSRISESGHATFSWRTFQSTLCRCFLSIIQPSKFSKFEKEAAHCETSGCHQIRQYISMTQEFSSISVSPSHCELMRLPCSESAHIGRVELQISKESEQLNIFVSPADVVLHCEDHMQENGRITLPIYRVLSEKYSLSAFSAPANLALCKGQLLEDGQIVIPIPRTEMFTADVVHIQLSYLQPYEALSAKATINVARSSSGLLLNIFSLSIALTPLHSIARQTNCSSQICLPYPRSDGSTFCYRQSDVERERRDASLTAAIKLMIPLTTSTSFAYHQKDDHFQMRRPSVCSIISLPLSVSDIYSYKSSISRVRRKRLGAHENMTSVFPTSRVDCCILNVCSLMVDRYREDHLASTDFVLQLAREESTILSISELTVQRHRQGYSDRGMGTIALPRVEYTAFNYARLTSRHRRAGFTHFSHAVIAIPRFDLTLYSVFGTDVVRTRQNSSECAEKVVDIANEDEAILTSLEMRVRRSKKATIEKLAYDHPIAREEDGKLSICELITRHQGESDTEVLSCTCPIPNEFSTTCSITTESFDMMSREVCVFGSGNSTVHIPAEEDASIHIVEMNVSRSRKEESSLVKRINNYSELDQYALTTSMMDEVFKREPCMEDAQTDSVTVLPIARKDVEVLRLSSIKMSRKRKHEEESALFVKRLRVEDRAGLFITEKIFCSDANRVSEVEYTKDPRLPLQCTSSFLEVSRRWRSFAHQHMPHLVFSSHLVTQLATLLQRVFAGAVDRSAITMKDLSKLLANDERNYELDVFTNPKTVVGTFPDSARPVWDHLKKLRMQRNSTELLSRKVLAPLYIFLGKSNVPRVGKPWRTWLKPLDSCTESRIGWQLALCMRIPDLVGVDDMDIKLQAVKMWWTVMMIRGTVPWHIYPCLSRRQLFVLARVLEAMEDVQRPPFCLYPPRAFFKGVKKVLRHPRMDLIPKDVYHPDITTMATLLKMKRNRVFHVDRSLPELLADWMEDLNKIDAYLADDVRVDAISSHSFLTQSEWAWKNFGHGCVPDTIKFDRNVSVEKTIEKLSDCLADASLPLEQRKQISTLKTALGAWSKYDKGPSIDQIPVDLINPFALSASLIALLPMPEEFVDDCFTFLEKVSKKSNQLRQNPPRKSTKSSANWRWKPNERLASAGKPISVGTKAIGKTTISTLFEEFWRSPKDFSTFSVFNKEESMSSNPHNVKNIKLNHRDSQVKPITEDLHNLLKKPTTHQGRSPVSHYSTVKQKMVSTFPIKSCGTIKKPRKRKDSAVDETRSASEVNRPFKKSRLLVRKRRHARTSDEEGASSAKQSMSRIPEHRNAKLRHTLARRGTETEKLVHETVSRAQAIIAVKGPNAPISPRKSTKRCGRREASTSDNSDFRTGQAARPTKRTRPATIFDVANFEWVLEMSLRRPRAFVGLYKTMRSQYRVLEMRRWVRKNRILHDTAQFEKFLKETSHHKLELIEKSKLLKAEKDMEVVLGVSRTEVQRIEKFAIKDLAHWYSMGARYAVEADVLSQKTLSEAKMLDSVVSELKKTKEESQKAAGELVFEDSVSIPLKTSLKMIDVVEQNEMAANFEDTSVVKKTLSDMISIVEQGQQHVVQDSPGDMSIAMLPGSSTECHAVASETTTIVSVDGNSGLRDHLDFNLSQEESISRMSLLEPGSFNPIVESLARFFPPELRFVVIADRNRLMIYRWDSLLATTKAVPPFFHVASGIPITSAYISVVLTLGVDFKLSVPFKARFRRPRRIDSDIDLLPPGDFSPYSTDEEWEDYYEKKEAFESHPHVERQLSWSSYGREDGDEYLGSHHCDCNVAAERAKEWVTQQKNRRIRLCYSEEVLPRFSNDWSIPGRSSSAFSCVSMGRLPVLEPPVSGGLSLESPFDEVPLLPSLSLLKTSKLRAGASTRPVSVPPLWEENAPLLDPCSEGTVSLTESRRVRFMYPRALLGCHRHIYSGVEGFATNQWGYRSGMRRSVRASRDGEMDLPDQWTKRDISHRRDFLRSVRLGLEARSQRSIPVLWHNRADENVMSESQEEADKPNSDAEDELKVLTRGRNDCPLEYPIAVYEPPSTWNALMQLPQSDKRIGSSPEPLEHSSEPSAFQRVLQRPQPIDLGRLDTGLETDEESDKISKWPLLKKLREAERELLAAGNPIAIERQRIREFNRQLRTEMVQEQGVLDDQLRQMNQLYLEYFAAQQLILAQVASASWIQFAEEQQGLLETVELQRELDQRWYSLLREEQQLTRRRTRDAVLTDMLFLRHGSSYGREHHSYFDSDAGILPNQHTHGFQDVDGNDEVLKRNICVKGTTTACLDAVNEETGLVLTSDEEESSIEVQDGGSEHGSCMKQRAVSPCKARAKAVQVQKLPVVSRVDDVAADPNIDVERDSTGSAASGCLPTTAGNPDIHGPASDNQAKAENASTVADVCSSSPEL